MLLFELVDKMSNGMGRIMKGDRGRGFNRDIVECKLNNHQQRL